MALEIIYSFHHLFFPDEKTKGPEDYQMTPLEK